MVARSEGRRALRFAGVFAAAATTVWGVLQAFPLAYQLEPLAYAHMALNVGGQVLWWLVLGVYEPSDSSSVRGWSWLLATQFLTSFVQGLAYAFLWVVLRGAWTRSRVRTIAYPIAVAVVSYTSFSAGVDHFDRVNCSDPGFDGDCDLGVFDGMMWAAIAFVIAIAVVVLIETLARRASRSESRS